MPWIYRTKEFSGEEECLRQLRSKVCAGASVTMPWKSTILPYLDTIDDSARIVAACNTVTSNADGLLRGWNHDWVGIAGALREYEQENELDVANRIGLIIGAGGAARAAIYALCRDLGVREIYILNRDDLEVVNLQYDVARNYASTGATPKILRIKSIDQSSNSPAPTYIVGTVPDFEPRTPSEKNVRAILSHIMHTNPRKGILVDMCYKPRRTRHIELAEKAGWQTVEGWRVVGHQARSQWLAWAGKEYGVKLDKLRDSYWKALEEEAEFNPHIN